MFSARSLTVCLLLAAELQLFRRWHWALDLTTHMQAHLLVAAIGVAVYFAVARQWRWMLVGVVLVLLGGWTVKPWRFWIPAPQVAVVDPTPLKLLVWNAFVHNPDPQSIARYAADCEADVVAILEWTEPLGAELSSLRESHPHHQESAFGGAFGIALYSRLPGTLDLITLPGPVPCLRFQPADKTLPIDLWAVHTLPPMRREYQALRDQQLVAVAERVSSDSSDRLPVVCGDLNITPWADQYQELLESGGMVDSRRGFGYAATWPIRLGWAGIPIDQVAVDPRIGVLDRTVRFASSGSDHAAVLIELAVPAAGRAVPAAGRAVPAAGRAVPAAGR